MSRKQTTILLIEDNVADQRLVRETLNEISANWSSVTQFDLVCVERLSVGLARLDAGGIDVVLLDLTLPDSSGMPTLRTVRAHAPQVPVVVLTSHDDETLALQAMQSGAQDYLVKGKIEGSLLTRAIRYAIERMHAQQERLQLLHEQAARAEAEKACQVIQRIQYVTDAALTALSPEELLRGLLQRINETFETDRVVILLIDEQQKNLTLWSMSALEKELTDKLCLPTSPGFAEPAVGSGLDNAYTRFAAQFLHEKGIESRLSALVRVDTQLRGVLQVGMLQPRQFSEEERLLLQLLADRIGYPLEHGHMYEAERQARAAAETANRLKDEFLATVSHELRTPLNAILGWTAILRNGKADAATSARALTTIEQNARAQSVIVEDILDVSRIITGGLRLDAHTIDVLPILEAAVEAVRPTAEAKGVHLDSVFDPDVGAISGDPQRLRQIVWNLLSNAIKFTAKGGHVRVGLARINSRIEITVTDSGSGIRPDFLPFVFDRFRQADSSSTRLHGGLGLGLAIVRHLTEMHGGSVAAESAGEGQGATFRVFLPVAALRQDLSPLQPSARVAELQESIGFSSNLQGLRILVVDDEESARELLHLTLTQSGAEVKAVASAAEALALLDEWPPHILVSDIGMPVEDGYMLIRKVRARTADQGGRIPAIALTAYAKAEDRLRALSAGYHMHVAKPVDALELGAVIASLAGRLSVDVS